MKILLKHLFIIVLFIVLFLGIGEFLRYILIDDTHSFTRIMFHELYTSKENIDIAFVGSSHCMNSFVPSIIDKKLNVYSFNMGSSSQCLDGSYIMIQELCSFNKPKHIYLELYYGVPEREEYKDRTQMTNTYILSDYMRLSFRKFIYLLNASSKDYYVDGFILARRDWKKLFDLDYIFNIINKKQNESYKNYQWNKKKQIADYVERGFVKYNNVKKNKLNSYWNEGYCFLKKATKLTEKNDWYKSLLQIIHYCKKKNIKLTFVIAPEAEWTVVKKENYQEYHDFIKNIADKYDLNFFDFNLCNAKYFNTNNLNLFYDIQHLNEIGAEQFSNLFADFINGKISKKELFYDTLQQKLDYEEPKVFGLGRPKDSVKLKNYEAYIISNREKEIEYKIEIKPTNSKTRLIQDYSLNKKFKLSSKEHGKLTVSWRLISNKDKINVIVADY